MRLVVDANALFSALIKDGKSAEIFTSFGLELFAPEFIFEEFEKHKNEILEKTHRNEKDFYSLLNQVENLINMSRFVFFVNSLL